MDVDPLVQSLCDKAFAGTDLQGFKQLISQLTPQQINGKSTRGQTALYCAARENHLDFARLLVQEGADINQPISGVNSTPLHGAAYHGHSEMVAFLLLAGANPELKNSGLDKLTPKEEATGGALAIFKIYDQQGVAGLQQRFPHLVWKKTSGSNKIIASGKNSSLAMNASGPTLPHSGFASVIKRSSSAKAPPKPATRPPTALTSSPSIPSRPTLNAPGGPVTTHKKGKLQVKEKSWWRDKDCILSSTAEALKISILKSDGRPEKEVIISDEPTELVCGVGLKEEYSPVAFWVLSIDQKRVLFKASTWQERREWLEAIHYACYPETVVFPESRRSEEFIIEWRNDQKNGKLTQSPSPDVWSSVVGKDSLNLLIQNMIEITAEDIFWSARKELDSIANGLRRANTWRDLIIEILKETKLTPHEMADWSNERVPFGAIEDLVVDLNSKLEKVNSSKKAPTALGPQLDRLKSIYEGFLNSCGSLPCPVFIKCGEQKIASRVAPHALCQLIVNAVQRERTKTNNELPMPTVRIGNVIFRVNPYDPGLEKAVSELNHLIWGPQSGSVVPLSIIVKLEFAGESILCQCSNAIDGVTLQELFEKAPDLVPYLDHENLSIHFVSSILSRPSRLTFNDLVVTTIEAAYEGKDEKRLVMYSYNYTSFVDEFAKKGFPPKKEMTVVGRTGSSTNILHEVMLRTSVWLMPQVAQPCLRNTNALPEIHPNVIAKLSATNVYYIVLRLFLFVALENMKTNSLYDQGVLTKKELYHEGVGGVLAHFSPNEATRLVETLKNVRHTMKHVSQTFLGLLSAIFPVLSIVYKTALSQIGPIPEDWREVPSIAEEWLFSNSRDPVELNTKLQAIPNWRRDMTTVKAEHRTTLTKSKTNKPESQIEKLLRTELNFFYLTPIQQKEVLWDLVKLPLEKLTIRGSSVLCTKHLEDLLDNRSLHTLSVIDCPGIVDSDLEVIRNKCNTFDHSQAITVVFENCEGLTVSTTELRYKNLKIKVISDTEKFDQTSTTELLTRLRRVAQANAALLPKPLVDCLMKFQIGANFETLTEEIVGNIPQDQASRDLLVQLFHKNHLPKIALEFGTIKMLKFLHDFLGPKFSSLARTMDSMLKLAVDHKQAAMAEFLIEHGAAKAVDFPFLLHVLDARMYKTAELILYENNHIAESVSIGLGDTTTNALGAICKFSDPAAASFVKYFLSINPCAHMDKRKLSSLHLAAANNAAETVKVLLDEEPSLIRYRDANKQTAYAYMSMSGHPKLATAAVLIERGWKPNFEDINIAITNKNLVALIWMVDPTKTTELPWKQILYQRQSRFSSHRAPMTMNEASLEPQAPANFRMPPANLSGMRSVDGKTLLHVAQGEPDMIDFLTALDPTLCHATNNMNRTLLWDLAEGEKILDKANTRTINILINAGANINAYHKTEGITLLHSALKNNSLGMTTLIAVITALIAFGADPAINPQDNLTTTLHLAVHTNEMAVVQLIGDQLQKKTSPAQLKDIIFNNKDNLTGMSPAKCASKSKALSKESEKYFKQLCKK